MRKIAVPVMMMVIGLLTVSSAHSQSRDPKEEQKRTAKEIDAQYQHATKDSSWSTSPKPLNDPWLTVKTTPAPGEKK